MNTAATITAIIGVLFVVPVLVNLLPPSWGNDLAAGAQRHRARGGQQRGARHARADRAGPHPAGGFVRGHVRAGDQPARPGPGAGRRRGAAAAGRLAVGYIVERWADERAAAVTGDRELAARAIARAALAMTAAPPR